MAAVSSRGGAIAAAAGLALRTALREIPQALADIRLVTAAALPSPGSVMRIADRQATLDRDPWVERGY